MIRKLKAFLCGMQEFRSGYTTNYCWELHKYYAKGREFAHRITLHRYDQL
jgi:hypothetical protein